MENYKIISDESELKKFIEWLPELENGECYYVALFARNKYCKVKGELKADKQQLKRFTSDKRFLLDKIKQLEVPIGCYKQGNNMIPEETLALYITVNPRSLEKAAISSLKKFADLVTKPYSGYNPHQEVLSQIQQSGSRTIYFDFDFDNTTISEMKPKITSLINHNCLTFVQTRGGFHLLVKIDEIDTQFKKNWYNNISKLEHVDVRGSDCLLPVVGCFQGGFTPKMI